jgi:hypothetical protein
MKNLFSTNPDTEPLKAELTAHFHETKTPAPSIRPGVSALRVSHQLRPQPPLSVKATHHQPILMEKGGKKLVIKSSLVNRVGHEHH